MKILYIAPYRQNDEWGETSRHFLEALILTGYDITARPVFFSTNVVPELSDEFEYLEQKKHNHYDVVIQKSLPDILEFNGNFDRNIGLCIMETSRCDRLQWHRHMNFMDEIWTNSMSQVDIMKNNGVTVPVHSVGTPIDVSIFETTHQPLDIQDGVGNYNFYYIGEFSDRSNLEALLLAFHSEFEYFEPVNLIINTTTSQEALGNFINTIKTNMRLYPKIEQYKNEIGILPLLKQEDEYKLHQSGNCFILPSRYEAFHKHTINALGFGNTVLVGDNTGMAEFIPNKDWHVSTQETIAYVSQPPLPYIYTGREHWHRINTVALCKKMRQAYESGSQDGGADLHTNNNLKYIQETMSYQTVAQNIKQLLET